MLEDTEQNFNLHTHTERCGHAFDSDYEYVEEAIAKGYKKIGFTDHIPFHDLIPSDVEQRMDSLQVDEYITSILSLKEKYSNEIEVLVGFEAEYDPKQLRLLSELAQKTDYLILGQHHINGISSENNVNYPLIYAESVKEGLETGLFDILAHPDYFMRYRDTINFDNLSPEEQLFYKDKNSYNIKYRENILSAAESIAKSCSLLGIPMEINYSPLYDEEIMEDGLYFYPNPIFWNKVKEYDIKAIYGIDAHEKNMIRKFSPQEFDPILDVHNIVFVDNKYNVIETREDRASKREQTIEDGLNSAPYGILFVQDLLEEISTQKDVATPSDLVKELNTFLENRRNNYINHIGNILEYFKKTNYSEEKKSALIMKQIDRYSKSFFKTYLLITDVTNIINNNSFKKSDNINNFIETILIELNKK